MKYFKGVKNSVYAYASDGSQDAFIKDGLIEITEKEALEIINPPLLPVAQADIKKNRTFR